MNTELAPIRERRQRWEKDPDAVRDVLREGTKRAREVARETMEAVRSAMGVKSVVEPL
jgi:tryptophanyl-tRNA synthetase